MRITVIDEAETNPHALFSKEDKEKQNKLIAKEFEKIRNHRCSRLLGIWK